MDLEKGCIAMLENFYLEILLKCVWCPCVSNEMNFLSMKWIQKGYLEMSENLNLGILKSVPGDSIIHY